MNANKPKNYKIIFLFIALIAGIMIATGVVMLVASHNKTSENSISLSASYASLDLNPDLIQDMSNDDGYAVLGLAASTNDFLALSSNYGSDLLDYNADFDSYNYLVLAYANGSCNGGLSYTSASLTDSEQLQITLTDKHSCGACAYTVDAIIIAVPKSIASLNQISFHLVTESANCDGNVVYKPILYLYPEESTSVTIQFSHPELLTTTYPAYNDAWHVTARPDGTLEDTAGKQYYALYWEEQDGFTPDFSTGFYVTSADAASFLEEQLTAIGLNYKEQNEFIMYWLPVLEEAGESLVYFAIDNEITNNDLLITPAPASLLRLRMYVKPVTTRPENIRPQTFTTFTRSGFTAVEWGGVKL